MRSLAHRLLNRRHEHSPDGDHHGGHGVMHSPRLYDVCNEIAWLGMRGRAYRLLAHRAQVQAGDRVVDLGCGTGELTRAVAALAGPSGDVIGIDLSPEMIAHATALGGGPAYLVGDVTHLPQPDNSIDVVVSALALHHVAAAQRSTALAEAARILRLDGRLLIAEFAPPAGRVGRWFCGNVLGPQMSEDLVPGIVAELRRLGLEQVSRGRVRPYLHYALAHRPAPQSC